MQNVHDYPDIVGAAQGLLCDAVRLLREESTDFVVVGGWSPFFLNSSVVRHPGTRDVDVLFKDGALPGALEEAIRKLRSAGYVHSAKHEFQLLRVLQVGGEDFMFNVDLLHASESLKNPELFVDHISLPVRVSEFSSQRVPKRSIVVPVSTFIFDGHIVEYETRAVDNDGNEISVTIPLMDELGTVVTKAESMSLPKRPRDVFDVVLAIHQARDRKVLANSAAALRTDHIEAFREIQKLTKIKEEPQLRENVAKYWGSELTDATWDAVLADVDRLLAPDGSASVPGGLA